MVAATLAQTAPQILVAAVAAQIDILKVAQDELEEQEALELLLFLTKINLLKI